MDLCDSLLKWIQTFTVPNPSASVEELMDGVAMAQVLHQISPQFFTAAWLSKIKTGAASDWRIKVSNLKKVQKGIVDFYAESLGQQVNESHMPDVTTMVEHNDTQELGRLLQMVLGCAINCSNKHEYIRRIMNMEESVQHDVMRAIQDLQELMRKESTPVTPANTKIERKISESEEQIQKLTDDLQKMSDEKDAYAQRCHDLDLQVVLLMEAKANLLTEVDRLNEKLNQGEAFDDPSSLAGRRYQQLQRQVEQLQEELYRAESARDDFRVKADSCQKELSELQQKNEELSSLSEETIRLKDELDILRHTAEKVTKYEASIASYKKKLEELSTVRGELKLLEEKNMTLMQKNLDLEEEVKKTGVLKTQLEAYRRQVQDGQLKCTEETKRADKAEFEAKRQQERASVLALDKERLIEERNSLKEMVDELRCSQHSLAPPALSELSSLDSHPPSPGSFELMSLPPDIRERVLRLQHENQLLKMEATSSEDCQLLHSMLDDANARKHELECEVRNLNQRVLELEANVNDLNEVQQKMSSNEDAASGELRRRLNEQMERCRKTEAELQKSRQLAEETETKLQASADETSDLKSQLAKKETEMKEMEEKYKKYLEKAKTVIRSMDTKSNASVNSSTSPEILTLRNQVQEKDKHIHLVEQENEKIKSLRENEEKLIVTAWYNLGSALHRKSADERLSMTGTSPAGPMQQSFLARQRQAHVRRAPGVAAPNSVGVSLPSSTAR